MGNLTRRNFPISVYGRPLPFNGLSVMPAAVRLSRLSWSPSMAAILQARIGQQNHVHKVGER